MSGKPSDTDFSDLEAGEDLGIFSTRDKYADFEPSSVPLETQANAAAAAALYAVDPPPVPSFEDTICSKGKCKYYWKLVTLGPNGDPDGPKQHHHICLVQPGRETDFGDDFVYECNKYSPKGLLRKVFRRKK